MAAAAVQTAPETAPLGSFGSASEWDTVQFDSWDTIRMFNEEAAMPSPTFVPIDQQTTQRLPGEEPDVTERLPEPVKKQVGNLQLGFRRMNRKADPIPTPGGIAAMLIALAVFLFAIVPVNGKKTRLTLLWDVITFQATLPAPDTANGSNQDIASAIKSASQAAAKQADSQSSSTTVPSITGALSGHPGPAQGSGEYMPYSPIGYESGGWS